MATLTVYAQTADDEIAAHHSVYATAAAGANLTLRGASATAQVVGQQIAGDYYIHESFEDFDTSSIPDSATISAATLSVYPVWNPTVNAWTLYAKGYDWGTTVTTADWQTPGQLSVLDRWAYLASGSLVPGAYRALTSDAAFLTGINKSGVTRMVLCSVRTQSATPPTDYELISYSTADKSGTTPKLVIEYSGPYDIYPVGIPSEEAFGTPAFVRPIYLLPEANYELSVLDAANKVFVVVEGSSPLVVGSATNTTVPPTYATSPREMVVTIKDGDASKCNTVAAAHLALRQVERYRLNGLPVPLRAGLLIRRGHKVRLVIPRAGVDVTMPVRRVEHDFGSNVSLIDVGEFALARDDSSLLADIAKMLVQLQKEAAI